VIENWKLYTIDNSDRELKAAFLLNDLLSIIHLFLAALLKEGPCHGHYISRP
jgi:hypothetical protein